uniref:Uncharacterized protein n=1 Tax=Candidatus Kentrum sp. LFY TaxID=2126342 RepID=A0A450WQ63_9GAMM|nr:MAG: hypothetical protein BECKLFY1418C_GA0070996_10551 [Candidatus Kentron sp. LFY]
MHGKDLFADGLIGLGIEAGLVRLDLGSLSVTQKDKEGNSILEHRQRVVMSVEAFLQTHRAMTGLLEHLEKTGAVTRREQPMPVEGNPESEKETPAPPPSPTGSPNFQ